jgi:hypothetical protein
MAKLTKDVIHHQELLQEIDPRLLDLSQYIRHSDEIPESLKEYFSEFISSRGLYTFARNQSIYCEYLHEKSKEKPRLPIRKGEGGLLKDIGDKYNISDDAVDTAITKMKKFFKES